MEKFDCIKAYIKSIKMKKIGLLCILAVALLSCAQQQKIAKELPSNISFSTSFQSFWREFTTDIKGLKSLENYTPSKALMGNQSVSELHGTYYVSGYLTINESFDSKAFEALGGEINRIDTTTVTFKMPLRTLPEMLKLKGIESVEAAIRVFKRK